MIETNICIVKPGTELYLDTRRAIVVAQDVSPDLLQKACNNLRYHHRLAAVPYGSPENPELLIASLDPISSLAMEGEDWRMEVKDSGQLRRLQFSSPEDVNLLAGLVQRCLLVEIGRRTDLWTLDSPRIWYQSTPFRIDGDVSAYRRFHVSVIPIEDEGLGVVIHISTAFFTNLTVADYFCNDRPENEQKRLRQRFEFLGQRQRGQKGTLLYDLGESKHKCYFEEFLPGITCGATGLIRVRGVTYPSLFEYYRGKDQNIAVEEDSSVAKVSLPGLKQPQPVAARLLRLRIMNEALPESLKQIDKIPPAERSRLIQDFWHQLGEDPLGKVIPDLEKGSWYPPTEKIFQISPPALEFANGQRLDPPQKATVEVYKKYYRNRRILLDKWGCSYVPPAVERTVHFAFPNTASEELRGRLSEDMIELILKWTRKKFMSEIVPYSTIREALSILHSKPRPGIIVFVFDDEDPATYFNLSFELKSWRIKRITYSELEAHFNRLVKARTESRRWDNRLPQGIRRWQSFVEMSALDVLQQLDCVPWSIATPLSYQAQLMIDVGDKRRYVAFSLLICRDKQYKPSFWLYSTVEHKPDPKQETINKVFLRDQIVMLFKRAKRRDFDPIESLLVLRDGRECGREIEGIRAAQQELINPRLGLLSEAARVDIVDLHKRSVKGIRMWERSADSITNVLEGTALFPDQKTVIPANTGAATLYQGTADPIMLVANGNDIDMLAVAKDVFATAQLNWSSPRVAQRLPLPSKRTDDELQNKSAQEIRHIR